MFYLIWKCPDRNMLHMYWWNSNFFYYIVKMKQVANKLTKGKQSIID